MSLPNRHLAGQTVHLSRHTTQRQFLLVNDKSGDVKNAMGYFYGLSIIKNGQTAHAACTMTNHYHICQTDNTSERSKGLQDFHHFSAKFINRYRERRESMWSNEKPGNQLLLDTPAIVDTLLDIWMEPVKANLVDKVNDWDHFNISHLDWGKPMRFERPKYFRTKEEGGVLPDFVEFTPEPPPGLDHLSLKDVIAFFEMKIRKAESEFRRQRKKAKKTVVGMQKCYEITPFLLPEKSTKIYEKLKPFKSSINVLKIAAIQALKNFRTFYRKRLEDFRKRSQKKFPAGTLQLVRNLNIACESLICEDPHLPVFEPFDIPNSS